MSVASPTVASRAEEGREGHGHTCYRGSNGAYMRWSIESVEMNVEARRSCSLNFLDQINFAKNNCAAPIDTRFHVPSMGATQYTVARGAHGPLIT